MSGNRNKVIAFNYFGGKFTFLDEIYSEFPDKFTHLVELFGGSMVISLNYKGRVIKTVNEINGEVTNFFEVLRDKPEELIRLLLLTPCSEQEYNNCWEKTEDKVEAARRFYVRVRQSFFGLGMQRRNKGWHMAKMHVNASGGETVSRWNNGIEKLMEIIRNNFQILNGSYESVIDRIDNEQAFFYADPPYPDIVRASKNDYMYEFTDENHIELAEKLRSIKGLAMVSSYENELYKEIYLDHGWRLIRLKPKQNNIRSGKVQEVLYVNYDKKQRGLFH